MTDFFFYGTLRHAPLLDRVLGRQVDRTPARLDGFAVSWAEGQPFPMIEQRPGAVAEGILVHGLTDADVARLDFYEGCFDYSTTEVVVQGGACARVYMPALGVWSPGAPFVLADWVARFGPVVVATAGDFMAQAGQRPARDVLRRYGLMLVRGASRVRAALGLPETQRRTARPADIDVIARRDPYAYFFSVEEYDLRHTRFDGTMSDVMTRAVFVSGDAATVLPYDPVRDVVMLIEQFRVGPFARGDVNPWLLEPIAGRVDANETPEACARREAVEEAGIALRDLLPIANYYPSPGAKAEFMYAFLGLADLPETAAGLGGLAEEAEDIRSHIVPFARLMELVASGEASNGPLILSAYWLAANRDRLRAHG
ncbi:MAG: gamma-glutamylcyclotransferase [Gemmobacter sp.]|nr:gamma-glutamylcyclotransferase [Gemmobacter sp.]